MSKDFHEEGRVNRSRRTFSMKRFHGGTQDVCECSEKSKVRLVGGVKSRKTYILPERERH